MLRLARLALLCLVSLLVIGCQTSEIKNNDSLGLVDGGPTGTAQSGYGDGHGDSVGGGGASKPIDAEPAK